MNGKPRDIKDIFLDVSVNLSKAITLLLVLVSCGEEPTIKDELDIIRIEPNLFLENVKLSSYTKNLELIPLESNTQSLIGQIDRITETDSFIYVLDKYMSRRLFVFNNEGQHIRNIGSFGTGLGEYAFPFDFIVKKDEILVLDGERKRIIHYNKYDATFIKYTPLDFFASEMTSIENGYAFIGAGHEDKLIITNKLFERLDSYFPYSQRTKNDMLEAFTNTSFNHTLFRMYLNDTIYDITNGKPKPYLFIDFGDKAFRSSDFDRFSEEEKRNVKNELITYMSQIKYYSETTKYRYFLFFYKNLPFFVYQNKDSGELRIIRYDRIVNDVTFERYPPLFIATKGEKFIGYIEPTDYFSQEILKDAPPKVGDVLAHFGSESNPLIFKLEVSF